MSESFLAAVARRTADVPIADPPQANQPPSLTATEDTLSLICGQLLTPDLLACASASTALQELCNEALRQDPSLRLRGPDVTGATLLWLVQHRMRGACERLDVSGCTEITKANVAQAVAASPALVELVALCCGPSAWTVKTIGRLLEAAPPSLRVARLDVRLELKNDLHADSPLLASMCHPAVCVQRLILIADNLTRAEPSGTTAADLAAAAAAAAAAAEGAATDDEEEDDEQQETAVPDTEASAALRRLAGALLPRHAAHLEELDASSGALSSPGATQLLLAPLLAAETEGALRTLSCTSLARGAMRTLAPALRANTTLTSLGLGSNLFSSGAARQLAAALEAGCARLTRLGLDHNPILDGGAAAVLATLPRTRLESVSLAFTGAADGACAALRLALGAPATALRELNLTGNRVTAAGAAELGAALSGGDGGGEAGGDGRKKEGCRLRSLTLTANVLMDGAAATAIANALPSSGLQSLALAGCNVDRGACARFAAALPRAASLATLDLSSNHFGDGCDELAWALPSCVGLAELSLADCALGDDEADELLEALGGASGGGCRGLARLDLRWNRVTSTHAVGNDARVNLAAQKGKSGAEMRAKEAAAKAAAAAAKGKKVYRPKWQREMKVTAGGGAA